MFAEFKLVYEQSTKTLGKCIKVDFMSLLSRNMSLLSRKRFVALRNGLRMGRNGLKWARAHPETDPVKLYGSPELGVRSSETEPESVRKVLETSEIRSLAFNAHGR